MFSCPCPACSPLSFRSLFVVFLSLSRLQPLVLPQPLRCFSVPVPLASPCPSAVFSLFFYPCPACSPLSFRSLFVVFLSLSRLQPLVLSQSLRCFSVPVPLAAPCLFAVSSLFSCPCPACSPCLFAVSSLFSCPCPACRLLSLRCFSVPVPLAAPCPFAVSSLFSCPCPACSPLSFRSLFVVFLSPSRLQPLVPSQSFRCFPVPVPLTAPCPSAVSSLFFYPCPACRPLSLRSLFSVFLSLSRLQPLVPSQQSLLYSACKVRNIF